jgi:hypothetical protein
LIYCYGGGFFIEAARATAQMPIFLTLFKLYGAKFKTNNRKTKSTNDKKKNGFIRNAAGVSPRLCLASLPKKKIMQRGFF